MNVFDNPKIAHTYVEYYRTDYSLKMEPIKKEIISNLNKISNSRKVQ